MIATQRLRELLDYNPATGIFRWRTPNRGRAKIGQSVKGWNAGKGYLMVGLDFKRYYLHRLAWQYIHGESPTELDHINLDKHDNRISNLRKCNTSQNGGNVYGRGKSGFKGVHFEKRTGRYYAAICKDYCQIYLGTFDTPEQAHAVYAVAAKNLFGQFARTE